MNLNQKFVRKVAMNTYKIIVLGATGSGKTVFLASLYNQRYQQSDRIGFKLKTDPERRRRLVEIYSQVANPQQEWPDSTDRSTISEWNFTCSVQNNDLVDYDILHFNYLDYAGGRITDPQKGSETVSSFDDAIKDADIFLCLLDGQKLLALIDKEEYGYELLNKDLPNLIPILSEHAKPVHFVITKWDLFSEDTSHSLKAIRDCLLEYRPFADFIESRKRAKKRPVRLVPVSAVGKNFARPQDDQMKKIGKNPKPFQVEMPLVCVLPDLFIAQQELIQEEEQRLKKEPVKVTRRTPLKVRLSLMAGIVTRVAGKVMPIFYTPILSRPLYLIEDQLIASLAEFFERGVKKEEEARKAELEQLIRKRDEALHAIQDEKAAIEYAKTCFMYQFKKLEEDLPESDFSK